MLGGFGGAVVQDMGKGGTITGDLTIDADLTITGSSAITVNETIQGTLTVGTDGSGQDVIFHSGTAGDNFTWDASAEKLTITGTDSQVALAVADGNVTITDDLDVDGTTNLDAVDIDGAVDMASTLAVAGTVTLGAAGVTNAFINSADSLYINIDSNANASADVFQIAKDRSTASGGTVLMSISETGAVSIGGDLDVDGTLNADAIDIDGALQLDATLTV